MRKEILILFLMSVLNSNLCNSQISINNLPFNYGVVEFNNYYPFNSTLFNATIPFGWSASSSTAVRYQAQGNGTSMNSGYWAYGTNQEYSIGALRSSTTGNITYSVSFINNTNHIISSITISWKYEQWRYENNSGWNCSGTGGLSGNEILNSKDFVGSSSGTNGIVSTTTISSFTINNISIGQNQSFGINWVTTDGDSYDNGISIDDFQLIANGLKSGDIFISHLSPDYNEADNEFLVLFNNTDELIDLKGYKIQSYDCNGTIDIGNCYFNSSTIIPPRKHYLLSDLQYINVGSIVNLQRDCELTKGMNSNGGQLVLTQIDNSANILFAVAWGTITNYVANMADAALWNGDGMMSLINNGNTYYYSSNDDFNFVNSNYHHTISENINFLPNSNTPLPITLKLFRSFTNQNNLSLQWQTSEELNNSGFEIERKSGIENWSKIGFVKGNNKPSEYYFEDKNLSTGIYNYRLKQIDYNGNFEYFELNNIIEIGKPEKFELSQNYPNPFNAKTVINWQIPKSGYVSIKIFDITGKEILTLINGHKEAGYYATNIDASMLSSGIYFYRMVSGNFSKTEKLLLIK